MVGDTGILNAFFYFLVVVYLWWCFRQHIFGFLLLGYLDFLKLI